MDGLLGGNLRAGLMAGAAIVCVAAATPAYAQTRNFNVPEQDAATGVAQFARQADLQLLISARDARGRRTNAVRGAMSVQDGLRQLLSGTGLRAEPTGASTYSVVPVSGEGLAGSAAADSGSTENREIVVTGSHLRGHTNSTRPVTTLDREYIQSTGVSTPARLIETLPQNFALTGQAGVSVPGISVNTTRQQGVSPNLRGIGEGTTLVLLNGHRLAPSYLGSAVDISALPLAAIERVEVLTDGASATYGSDAVGGVINFILRRDYEGAETQLRRGWAAGGVDEYRASQVFGHAWSTGSILVSGEYYKRDLLPANRRDFVPSNVLIGSLFPRDENYSFMFSARQELSDRVEVYADGIYSHRDSFNRGGRVTLLESYRITDPQFSGAAGMRIDLGSGWQVEGNGMYSRDKLLRLQNFSTTIGLPLRTRFEIGGASVRADGPLFSLPGGSVRLAVGGEWRAESLDFAAGIAGGGTQSGSFDQDVSSLFFEGFVPVVGPGNARSGVQRLELSIAGRYDHYSSFGSSFDPQVGAMWEPIRGMRLRASYGTSYRAPKLADYDVSSNSATAATTTDASAPGGLSTQLQIRGTAGIYDPQTSRNLSAGLELRPAAVPGFRLSASYYSIRYRNQIANTPTAPQVLANPAAFGALIIRNPTVAQVQQYIAIGQLGVGGFQAFNPDFTPNTNFDPSTISVIVDLRRRNLSVTRTSGIDVSASYDLPTRVGNLHFGIDGTYILERIQQTTATSPSVETVGTFFNPPHLRMRGSLGWSHAGWAANFFVNHIGSFTDNRTLPSVPVSSYTTVDGRLAYSFGEGRGLLSGLTISVSAQNLLNQDPPSARVLSLASDIGFDPTKANPIGRLVAIEISRRW
jgi:outer membrane receptor protein involved in Fe transport